MPIYEYKCSKCRKKFEVLQRINDQPVENCIYCQGKVQKLISNTSFQLKGSGWYVTDYKKSNHTESEDSGKKNIKNKENKNKKNEVL